MKQTKKKLAILGNGYLAGIITEAYGMGLLEGYEMTGILGRTEEKTRRLAEAAGCRACASIEELLEAKPDYVAEAASVAAVRDYGKRILCSVWWSFLLGHLQTGDFMRTQRDGLRITVRGSIWPLEP